MFDPFRIKKFTLINNTKGERDFKEKKRTRSNRYIRAVDTAMLIKYNIPRKEYYMDVEYYKFEDGSNPIDLYLGELSPQNEIETAKIRKSDYERRNKE